jgi:hypothetical protein
VCVCVCACVCATMKRQSNGQSVCVCVCMCVLVVYCTQVELDVSFPLVLWFGVLKVPQARVQLNGQYHDLDVSCSEH